MARAVVIQRLNPFEVNAKACLGCWGYAEYRHRARARADQAPCRTAQGRILVDSAVGNGSTFRVMLPVRN